MSFLVTARKYRPARFTEVVAQDHVVQTLLNAIRGERIAHAYLFCGPRGVGKTTTARIFAKALNCRSSVNGEPCNVCDSCVEITEGRCMDIIEIDGASNNGVDQVRDINRAVRLAPAREKYKMYIIDEVHMLSAAAFNALLKTLEEPPAHAIFVFATTEAHKLPPTVISRCQRHDFRRIRVEDIVGQLHHICASEQIEAEDKALYTIARKADGSMRDAESIFDQIVAYSGDHLTFAHVHTVLHVVDQDLFFRITDLILTHDAGAVFPFVRDLFMNGYDPMDFLAGLEEHFRHLLVARSSGDLTLIETDEETRAAYANAAGQFSEATLLRLLASCGDAMQAVKYSAQPRLRFETALIAMVKMDETVLVSDILARLGLGPSPTRVHSAPADPGSSSPPPPASGGRTPAASTRGSDQAPAESRSLVDPLSAPASTTTRRGTASSKSSPPSTTLPSSLTATSSMTASTSTWSLDTSSREGSPLSAGMASPLSASALPEIHPTHPVVRAIIDTFDAEILPPSSTEEGTPPLDLFKG